MRLNPYVRARYNMTEAADALHMPVRALSEHAERGNIKIDYDHGYNFVAVDEQPRPRRRIGSRLTNFASGRAQSARRLWRQLRSRWRLLRRALAQRR